MDTSTTRLRGGCVTYRVHAVTWAISINFLIIRASIKLAHF